MFRKRRRPTPGFKIPSPFNPINGENANLRQDGISPFCAMVQVIEDDIYDNYVVCRIFDPRILRYMENISVAKPYGKRTPDTYQVAEIYPAFLPTQGNASFMDFRQVVYMPPSPTDVQWRVGQNPGKVTGGGLDGGQPETLSDAIEVLYDHNGKVVNWILIDSNGQAGGGTRKIQGPLIALVDGTGPYTGAQVATITIRVAPCANPELIDTDVDVVDWSGCVFDLPEDELLDVWVWASEGITESRDPEAEPGDLTPCHWIADDRCCDVVPSPADPDPDPPLP